VPAIPNTPSYIRTGGNPYKSKDQSEECKIAEVVRPKRTPPLCFLLLTLWFSSWSRAIRLRRTCHPCDSKEALWSRPAASRRAWSP